MNTRKKGFKPPRQRAATPPSASSSPAVDYSADQEAPHRDEAVLARLHGKIVQSALAFQLFLTYVTHIGEITGWARRAGGSGDKWEKAARWMVRNKDISRDWKDNGEVIQIKRMQNSMKNTMKAGRELARKAVTSGASPVQLGSMGGTLWWQHEDIRNYFMTSTKGEVKYVREAAPNTPKTPAQLAASGQLVVAGDPSASQLTPSAAQLALRVAPIISLETTTTDGGEDAYLGQEAAMAAAGTKRKRGQGMRQQGAREESKGKNLARERGEQVLQHQSEVLSLEKQKYTDYNTMVSTSVGWAVKTVTVEAAGQITRAILSLPKGVLLAERAGCDSRYHNGMVLLQLIPQLLAIDTITDAERLHIIAHALKGEEELKDMLLVQAATCDTGSVTSDE